MRPFFGWAAGAAVLCAAASVRAGEVAVSVSDAVPREGEAFTATVSAPPGAPVWLYYAEGLQKGTALDAPLLLASGTADASGSFRFDVDLPAGIAGESFGLQACGLEGRAVRSSSIRSVMVAPSAARAAWICTPTEVLQVATGQKWTKARPVEFAYVQSRPGDVIVLEPGVYEKFQLKKPWVEGQALTWILARSEGTVRIARWSVGGSATLDLANAGFVALADLEITPSDNAAVLCAQYVTIPSVHFLNCRIVGEFDTYARTGPRAKWGVLGWQLRDFVWLGGEIRDISDEHAFYLHNCEGDVSLLDTEVRRLGRTALQVTARSTESKGNEGRGRITVRNVLAEDTCLEGNVSGGSTFTFAGRHRDPILLDHVRTRAGFDGALNLAFGKVTATGAFVSHFGGGSDNVPNGPITLVDSSFEIAPNGGDRTHLSVAATDFFRMERCVVTAGRRYALEGFPGSVPGLSLDRASVVTSGAATDCRWGAGKYATYPEMLDALGF